MNAFAQIFSKSSKKAAPNEKKSSVSRYESNLEKYDLNVFQIVDQFSEFRIVSLVFETSNGIELGSAVSFEAEELIDKFADRRVLSYSYKQAGTSVSLKLVVE